MIRILKRIKIRKTAVALLSRLSVTGGKMGRYDDIINLPHHVSDRHPRMSAYDRAAQFSPFAALTGYGEVIDEAARLTDDRIYLDPDEQAALDEKLRLLESMTGQGPGALITYFQQDMYKEGGAYITVSVYVKKIDRSAGMIISDGAEIPVSDIIGIELQQG